MMSKMMKDRSSIEVVVRPETGIPTPKDRVMELTIQKFAEEIVCTKQFPRCGITLIVQHICPDGAQVAICLNAVWLALLDSGVPMTSTVLSMGVALSSTHGLLLDPTWNAAVTAAQAGCKALENFVRTACEKRMEKLPV